MRLHKKISLQPQDNERLANLCGQFDEHLKQIERHYGIEIANLGHDFKISGQAEAIEQACALIQTLYDQTRSQNLNRQSIHLSLQTETSHLQPRDEDICVHTGRGIIRPRGKNQALYLKRLMSHDINFGIGPAGTGKTYLAVACAVQALQEQRVRRLILTRPAVEAGENLGFLPGDLNQKIDPYLRPLYDALYDMLGFDKVSRLIEKNIIEVAPLAFMRGRSLNEAFIILDEAQNTTSAQMKMFLTRTGFGSTVVITGDITQIDLPDKKVSGLTQSMHILQSVRGISFTRFHSRDVVRHPLVQKIVDAYEAKNKE